jgi:hypothetical protein
VGPAAGALGQAAFEIVIFLAYVIYYAVLVAVVTTIV